MGNERFGVVAALAVMGVAAGASAEDFDVVGGQTNVLLDTAALSSAASLDLFDAPGAIAGDLGPDSVAFPINSRNAASLPTTFSYDAGLGAFSGTIEHTGTVRFNGGGVEVGNFTIGFDAGRVGGDRSGFFVESTTGIPAILFDVENPSALTADASGLSITANLLVSSEFASFLTGQGLASTDLTGVDVGDALVAANVPAPGALAVAGLAALAATRRRR